MVDVQLAFNKLLGLGVEIRLAPNLNRVDIFLARYWDGVRHQRKIEVDFLDSKAWLKHVVSAGEELADILRNKV
jgi:hypothetical protein